MSEPNVTIGKAKTKMRVIRISSEVYQYLNVWIGALEVPEKRRIDFNLRVDDILRYILHLPPRKQRNVLK